MTHRLRYVVAGTLTAVLAGGMWAYAQGPGGPGGRGRGFGPGPGFGRGAGLELRGLNLTDVQREQIRQLTQTHREQTRTLAERVRAAHEAQRDAMQIVPVNEGQIRAAVQQAAEATADLAVERARLMADIRGVLTPEQLEQLEAKRAARDARMKQRRARRLQQQQN